MMCENSRSIFNRPYLQGGIFTLIVLLLIARVGYGQMLSPPAEAILQGSIQILPTQPVAGDQSIKIQPGTPVKLSLIVENKGSKTSPAGEAFVRFAFAKPLDREPGSLLFETKAVALPSIEPGKQIELALFPEHNWPSLFDFVKYDWSMREYQAFVKIDDKEHLVGTMAITFSAYYYPGVRKEMPYEVSNR